MNFAFWFWILIVREAAHKTTDARARKNDLVRALASRASSTYTHVSESE